MTEYMGNGMSVEVGLMGILSASVNLNVLVREHRVTSNISKREGRDKHNTRARIAISLLRMFRKRASSSIQKINSCRKDSLI